MKIDAHQHFWKFDPARYPWISDRMTVLQQDYLPTDLKPLLEAHALDGSVAVQAEQSHAENAFLLELADRHPFIKGVVGWVDLTDPLLPDRLDRSATNPVFKGVRHPVQAEPPGFLLQREFVAGVQSLAAWNLSYDLLIYEHQLEEAYSFLKQIEGVRVVIDHIAKPKIAEGSFDHWAHRMTPIAALPHVVVKLSGLVTEADHQQWKHTDFDRYLDFCLEQFGPERLMFGSDWPVCLLAADYSQVHQLIQKAIGQLTGPEQAAILGETAVHFYQLEP